MDRAKARNSGNRIISVGGGKGGVGKSLVATNLAVAIAQTGREVVLCDLDLGAANLHLMMGVTQPKPGIAALLNPEASMDEALTETSVPRLRLLAGTGATVASANITHSQKLRIIRKLRALPSEFVIVDVGAGVGYNALDFFELGQQRIIVATPQVTSMHDAYAFLKGSVLRTLRHHAAAKSEAWMLDPALESKEGEKVKDLLLRVRQQDAKFGAKIEQILKHFGAFLVGNQVDNAGQAGVFQAVSRMVEEFLGIELPILGWIPANARFADSVNDRKPYMARLTQGESREMRAFRTIVEALLAGDVAPEEELLVELVEEGSAPEMIAAEPSSPAIDPRALPVRPPAPPAAAFSRSPVPGSAPPPAPPATAAAHEDSDLPAPVKPRVYVRPSRKRKAEPDEKKRKRQLDAQGRRRKITLPGMPPVKD